MEPAARDSAETEVAVVGVGVVFVVFVVFVVAFCLSFYHRIPQAENYITSSLI